MGPAGPSGEVNVNLNIDTQPILALLHQVAELQKGMQEAIMKSTVDILGAIDALKVATGAAAEVEKQQVLDAISGAVAIAQAGMDDLKAQIADLQAQVAAGADVTEAFDAVNAAQEAVVADIAAIVPDAAPVP